MMMHVMSLPVPPGGRHSEPVLHGRYCGLLPQHISCDYCNGIHTSHLFQHCHLLSPGNVPQLLPAQNDTEVLRILLSPHFLGFPVCL